LLSISAARNPVTHRTAAPPNDPGRTAFELGHTQCCDCAVMNANFFGLKRAYHGTLRLTRASLARLGLTAARFDLLYALPHRFQRFEPGMRQSALRGQLGVSRPTVSRMLVSLERLGLVYRKRSLADGRQRIVALTRQGRTLIRKAERIFIHSGWAQLALDTALDVDPQASLWCDDVHCLFQMDKLEGLLRRLRVTFGDVATLYYPWHPDD
jgi:DNA-binding MarR family transcriptional regulator